MNRNPFARGRSGALAPTVGLFPGMAMFTVFALAPAIAVFALSFTNISGIPNVPWQWTGWKNYERFFFSGEASANISVVWRTLIFCLSITLIQNAIALIVAVMLNRNGILQTLMRAVVFMPIVLGVTVIGLIWTLFFNPSGGPAASIWGLFGGSSAFFGDSVLSFPLIIAVQIWTGLGYSMMIFIAGLQAIPSELYEQARVDGASKLQQFRNVTVPMLAPSITANVLIAIIGSLQAYQLIYVLTGDKPTTSVLAMRVFTVGFSNSQQGYASAISVVQFVMVGVITLVALFILRRKETQL